MTLYNLNIFFFCQMQDANKDPLHSKSIFLLFMSPKISKLDLTDSYLYKVCHQRWFYIRLLEGKVSELFPII